MTWLSCYVKQEQSYIIIINICFWWDVKNNGIVFLFFLTYIYSCKYTFYEQTNAAQHRTREPKKMKRTVHYAQRCSTEATSAPAKQRYRDPTSKDGPFLERREYVKRYSREKSLCQWSFVGNLSLIQDRKMCLCTACVDVIQSAGAWTNTSVSAPEQRHRIQIQRHSRYFLHVLELIFSVYMQRCGAKRVMHTGKGT